MGLASPLCMLTSKRGYEGPHWFIEIDFELGQRTGYCPSICKSKGGIRFEEEKYSKQPVTYLNL